MISTTNTDQGLAGVAALIIFIALVLVGAITAAVILDVAGSLEQQAAQTGEEATEQISSTLQIYERTAQVDTSSPPSVSRVEFILGVAPGTSAVNLDNLLITMTTQNDRFDLISEDSSASLTDPSNDADNVFNISEVTTSTGDNILRGSQQRYNITVKSGDGPNRPDFDAGQNIQITFTSGAGGQAFQQIRIPNTIDSSRQAIRL